MDYLLLGVRFLSIRRRWLVVVDWLSVVGAKVKAIGQVLSSLDSFP